MLRRDARSSSLERGEGSDSQEGGRSVVKEEGVRKERMGHAWRVCKWL